MLLSSAFFAAHDEGPGVVRDCFSKGSHQSIELIYVFSKPNSASLAAVGEKICVGRRNSFP
jgi:hypothetical protein